MVEEARESPEDMSQQQCIFCHIAAGRVASRKIYEDDKVVAVLDINPANPGHILVVTKEHFVIMPQVPEDVLQHLGMVAKALSHAQLRALKSQGTNIFVANGIIAGQRAQHFMLHVIPRMEGDQVSFSLSERAMNPADAKKLQAILRKALAKPLGFTMKEEPAKKKFGDEEREAASAVKEEIEPEEKETAPEEKEAVPENDASEEKEKTAKKEAKKPAKGANLDEIARLLAGGS
jgi:histidine triad (HIT) family protein